MQPPEGPPVCTDFTCLPSGAAFAHVVDEGLERRAQRHLHQARVAHLAHQREDLGAGALGAAGLAEPRGALE